MKILPIKPNIQPKNTFLSKVKSMFGSFKYTLKLLKEDVFEYVKQTPYVVVDGKKVYRTKYVIIDGKKVPKSELKFGTWDDADCLGVKWLDVKYYPEDIEKMKNMSTDEVLSYKKKLKAENKFYYDNADILKKK